MDHSNGHTPDAAKYNPEKVNKLEIVMIIFSYGIVEGRFHYKIYIYNPIVN